MFGHNVIVVPGWLVCPAVQVNNFQFVCDDQPRLNRPAPGQPVKSIRNQMKYFSFPVGYPPPVVAIWTWS
jgi:hypothetical protein